VTPPADVLADQTMLDLFRSEMESLGAALNNALLDLEETPDNAQALETLKGAAHSVKGGAKIAELEDAVRLAHAMEDVFKAVEEGRHALRPADIDRLLDATDLLIRMAETAGKAGAEGVSTDAAQERIAAVAAIPAGKPSAAASGDGPPPEDSSPETAAPRAERSPAGAEEKTASDAPRREPAAAPSELERPASDAAEETAPPAPARRAARPAPSPGPRSSAPPPSLLDTFREEMDGWSDALMESLDMLRDDPFDPAALPTLSATIDALVGGARLVELDDVVALAREMERCFEAADARRLELAPEQIDRLVDAVDLLLRTTRSPDLETDPSVSPAALGRLQRDIAAIADAAAAPASDREPAKAGAGGEPDETLPATRETAATERAPAPAEGDAPAAPDGAPADPAAPPPAPRAESSPAPGAAASPGDDFGPADPGSAGNNTDAERTVRVTAAKIERLMGLAGEVVVGARWLPPFSESLFLLKRGQSELANLLEDLQKVLETGDVHRAGKLAFQSRERLKGLGRDLAERMGELDMFTSVTANLSDRLYHEVIGVRMSPFGEGIRGYRRSLRDLARELGKRVRLEVVGESTEVDRDILERITGPLTHLLRNAVDHGIESPEERRAAGKEETGALRLEAAHRAGMLIITVADDGRGVDPDSIRRRLRERGIPGAESADRMSDPELLEYLFQPGFSTAPELTSLSGRGMGLNVVQAAVHQVGGMVRATSRPGEGTRFQMELPLALSVVRTFLVEIAGEPYAFPLARIDRCLRLAEAEIQTVEDRQYFMMDGQNVALVNVHEVLEIADPPPLAAPVNVVVVSDRDHAYGLVVDRFLGEFDLVVRPLDARLGKVPDISAAAVMLDGSPVLIFDVEDLVHSIDNLLSGTRRLRKIAPAEAVEEEAPPPRVLVVEDSFIVREKERKLLENRGYQVEVAVDGMDGWNLVRTAPFDMVISDVDMPRMNGFELIRNIKRHAELSRLPVIIVSYKFTEADRLEGLEAGADYYLSKTDFDDNTLIDAVMDLIGEP
jgi:two-component system sensor histidine kinase and response regulator WspE